MKKFLSLVLALVMTMSLVTISAGAKDFTDDDKITYEEAVNVISEIGVVDGYADGKFNPTNTLTRQAAAKIICNLILGPTTAAELHADTAPYKDVPATSEFAGYIAYCAKEGIISGYADGTFKPGNTLTGYAFMKMLLGALGYDAEVEGYTGGNWSINVAKQAINIGLNKSLEGDFNGIKAVTREEACLYAFNTLKADLVEYDTKITTTVNGATVTIGTSNAKAQTWNNSATRKSNIKDDQYIQFAEQYFNKLVLENTTDVFGRPARTWTYKSEEIGTYTNYDLLVETYTDKVTGKALYTLLGKNVVEDEDYDIEVDVDGAEQTISVVNEIVKKNEGDFSVSGKGALLEVYVDNDTKDVKVVVVNTYLAIATADYSEKSETATLTIYGVQKSGTEFVKDVKHGTDKKVSGVKVSSDDFAVVADVEKDDAYLVTLADGEVQSIEAAEVVEDATISAFKNNSKVVADGTTYNYAVTAQYDYTVLDQYDDNNLKETSYNIYLDVYGNLIGLDIVEAVKNYVFVTGIESVTGSNLTDKNPEANLIFIDGTAKVAEIKAAKNETLPRPGATVNTWFSYTEKDGVYTLSAIEANTFVANTTKVAQSKTSASEITIDLKHTSLVGISGMPYVYGNDDTVYLTADLGKVGTQTVIKGVSNVTTGVRNASITTYADGGEAEAKASTGLSDVVYTLFKSNGYVIAAVVVGEDEAVSSNLVYVNSSDVNLESYSSTDDEWTWTREVILNGEAVNLTEVGDTNPDIRTMDENKWYYVEYYANGNVKSVTLASQKNTNNYAYVTGWSQVESVAAVNDTVLFVPGVNTTQPTLIGNTIYLDNGNTRGFFVADDVKVVLIQKNNNKTTTTYTEGVDTLEAALDNLNSKSGYSFELSAIIEEGAGKIVVIKDKNDDGYTGGDKTGSSVAGYSAVVSTATMSVTVTGPANVEASVLTTASAALEDAGYEISSLNKGVEPWEYTVTNKLGGVSTFDIIFVPAT